MKKKIIIWTTIVVAVLLAEGVSLYILISKAPFRGPFRDEPKARALYAKVIESMRQADSLSYTVKSSGQTSSINFGIGNLLSQITSAWRQPTNEMRSAARLSATGSISGFSGRESALFYPRRT